MQETGLLELFKLHLLNRTFTLNFHKQGKNHTIDNTQHAIYLHVSKSMALKKNFLSLMRLQNVSHFMLTLIA